MQGFMSLAELVQMMGVSDSTVRRDLEILEEQGLIRRAHGGAVYVNDAAPGHRLAFADRQTTAAAEKKAVARSAAELIRPNATVIIDGGTTCFQVASALAGRRLSVVTNSVPIASLLSADVATEVTLIGGYVYPRTGVALGQMAEQQLDYLHAAQLVLSCAGLTEEGAFNSNQMMVEVERKMMGIADEVILVADHTKFGMRAVVKLCGLDELDVIVTDDGADERTRAWLDRLSARVLYAKIESER
ncbi:MAG TPA: DeoR/GlpR family DNA-binding transcription regulator [Phycisphaerae bacterium]|nr:DeoR/GlpR family DNA-binding transcription regulator [Phycisphaerae bacterium]HQL72057.1 DeoR/GlpR family DNA-binding transcription regulator [Phycisphaerae bacterium]